MDDMITRAEHEEFRRAIESEHRRLEAEDTRQNGRLKSLEESVKKIGDIAISVEKLATSLQKMVDEQKRQGEKLEKLEGRDGERWRSVIGYVITAVISIVIGLVAAHIGAV